MHAHAHMPTFIYAHTVMCIIITRPLSILLRSQFNYSKSQLQLCIRVGNSTDRWIHVSTFPWIGLPTGDIEFIHRPFPQDTKYGLGTWATSEALNERFLTFFDLGALW